MKADGEFQIGPTKKRDLFNTYKGKEQAGTSTIALPVKSISRLQTAIREESFDQANLQQELTLRVSYPLAKYFSTCFLLSFEDGSLSCCRLNFYIVKRNGA